jgi:hypothetical protein
MKQEIINELSERYTVIDGSPPNGGREIAFVKEGAVKVNNLWTWYLAPACMVLDLSTLDTVYVEETEKEIIITAVRE